MLNTIVVDDELWAMNQFIEISEEIPEINILGKFRRSADALDFAQHNKTDFALLDIEMPGINGIELAKKLKEINPDTIIIFVTAYEQYAIDAAKLRADAYILKPYTKEDVEAALKKARTLAKGLKKGVFIKTFGSFDVFADGKPLSFSSAKAKELLALIVQKNGGVLTREEAFATIWEDKAYNDSSASLYRKVALKLKATLDEAGIGDILISVNEGKRLDTERFDCDLYQFLDGNKKAINSFYGEYMSNYSWGETTLAYLIEEKIIRLQKVIHNN